MNKLSLVSAKSLAEKYIGTIEAPDSREFCLLHTKAVVKILSILTNYRDIDKQLLKICGWVHDIGYSINQENHAQHTLEILEKEDYEINDTLKDCILNHGVAGKPATHEGRLMQAADKISFLNPDMVEVFIKNNKYKIKDEDIDFLKSMCDKAIEYLKDFRY